MKFSQLRGGIVATAALAVTLGLGISVPALAAGSEGGSQVASAEEAVGNSTVQDAPSSEGRLAFDNVSGYAPGWLQIDSTWYYLDPDGYLHTGWLQSNGSWYYLDPSTGALASGWVKVDDSWYYLHDAHDSNFGAMQTGWTQINGAWYYLDPMSGAAAEDGELTLGSNGYAFDASCRMGQNGWCQAGGHWYWAGPSGALQTGWKLINGSWYYFDPSNYAMATGVFTVGNTEYVTTDSGACPANAWVTVDGTRYRTDGSSAVRKGWLTIDGSRYYFDADGKAATGTTKIGNSTYQFSSDGTLAADAWVTLDNGTVGWASSDGVVYPADATISSDGVVTFNASRGTSVTLGDATFFVQDDGSLLKGWDSTHRHYADPDTGKLQSGWVNADGEWYYSTSNGTLATGWQNIGGTWYYFDADGTMHEGWLDLGGVRYYLTPGSGAMTTGWLNLNGTWYWFDASGAMQTGWLNLNGTWYYLMPETGAMATGWLNLNGAWYYLDPSSGAMTPGNSWRAINGKWYLFQASGATYTGWYHEPGGSLIWYYLDPDTGGAMVAGTTKTIDGTVQNFRPNGIWAPSSGVQHLDDICDWVIDNVTGYSSVNNDALRRLYNWACKYPYARENEYPGGGWRDWSIPYAQEMWDNGRGNCYRYASIVCWVARRLGYDANTVSGWVPARSGQDAHGWCEVHIDGTTYIIDCSLGRSITNRNFFMITYNNAPTTYHIISR